MSRPGNVALTVASALALAVPTHADDAKRIKELEAKLEQSLKTIDALARRVSQLESQTQAQPEVATVSPPTSQQASVIAEQTNKINALETQVSQLSQSMATSKENGLPLHGFVDVGYDQMSGYKPAMMPSAWSEHAPNRGFFGGTVDFYLTPSYGRVKGLAELALEYESTKSGGTRIDMERLQVGYTLTDATTLWLGRFHTPYGYWNTAYHHGAAIQPSLSRPDFLRFEDHGGLLPIHTVGAWLTSSSKFDGGKFLYDAYVGNGDSIQTDGNNKPLLFGTYTDDNSTKALGFRVALDLNSGAQFGLHGFRDGVDVYANGTSTTLFRNDVRMLGAYAFYEDDNWNLLGEYYHFNNRNNGNYVGSFGNHTTANSNLWFVQAGYTFAGEWFPYFRYERTSLDRTDSHFASLDAGVSYDKPVLGIRYNIDPRSAIKVELARTKVKPGVTLNTAGAPSAEAYPGSSYSEVKAQFATSF
jgi:hypothetical protein